MRLAVLECNQKIRIKSSDRIGQKFGKLTILSKLDVRKKRRFFSALCDCGNIIEVRGGDLFSENTQSCGCIRSGYVLAKHRMYPAWYSMNRRCSDPKDKAYHNYGGRGIQVCEDWQDFATFDLWVSTQGNVENLQIDRIDNNGNYEPSNCRFVTPIENCNNRRNSVLFMVDGVKMTLEEARRALPSSHQMLYAYNKGTSPIPKRFINRLSIIAKS
jgi:hypothetical protein